MNGGRGDIAVQGAAARLTAEGNCLIIMSFEVTETPIDPQMILVDENNDFVEFLEASSMSSRFTEQETESYYDAEDAIYRAIWDEDGSVHWGYFDNTTGTDFLKGCANLDRIMVEKGGINANSTVLDLGCGNGTTAIWLAGYSGCHATGIDLSGVRIDKRPVARERQETGLRERLAFEKAIGHRTALRRRNLQPRVEPGCHLPRAG